MKLVRSNGLRLEIRDVGEIVVELHTRRTRVGPMTPLPLLDRIMSDDEARDQLREMLASGEYDRAK